MEEVVRNLEALKIFAEKYAAAVSPHAERATLITLSGDLGAGKTAFTKMLAAALGIEEHITSPTFVLAKHYKLSDQKFDQLIHIDAYRLEQGEDLGPIEFERLLQEPGNLIMLEWPERVESAIPEWAKNITIKLSGETRVFTYER